MLPLAPIGNGELGKANLTGMLQRVIVVSREPAIRCSPHWAEAIRGDAMNMATDNEFRVAVPVMAPLEVGLPEGPPEVAALAFAGPGGGWPPSPSGREQVVFLTAEPRSGSLSDEAAEAILERVVVDEQVLAAVGARFAHLNTDSRAMVTKSQPADCAEPIGARLLFFSHSRNVAVEVNTLGTSVQTVADVAGYQPAEGPAEIDEAICLAREDPRLAGKVELLHGHAILLPSWGEQPGSDHRLMWVTFKELDVEHEVPALFTALVDLTDQRVLFARPEPPLDHPANGPEPLDDEPPADDRGPASATSTVAPRRAARRQSSTQREEGAHGA